MSVQQNLIAGVCVAIGIASVGISLKAGIDHFVDRDRVVTVKGLAERNVQADYVIWPVTFRVTGNDLSALYEKAQTQSEEIRNFLISQGIKAQDISQGTPSFTAITCRPSDTVWKWPFLWQPPMLIRF